MKDESRRPIHHSSFILPPSAAARAIITIGYPWWLRFFLARDVIAVTLGRRIFLREKLEGEKFERLLRHELAHVRQADDLGLIVFLWRYLAEFGRHWVRLRDAAAAYSAISFEIEARAAEEDDSGTGL